MFFKTLVESILKQMADPDDNLALNAMNTLTRDIKNDLIQAYNLSEPLVEKHTWLFWNSSSFLDFLIKISKLPYHKDYHPNLSLNRCQQMADLDKCNTNLEESDKQCKYIKSQLTDVKKKLEKCEEDKYELEQNLEKLKRKKTCTLLASTCKEQKNELENELEKCKRNVTNLKEENSNLQMELKRCQNEIQNAVRCNSDLNTTYKQLALEYEKIEKAAKLENNTLHLLNNQLQESNQMLTEYLTKALTYKNCNDNQIVTVSEIDSSENSLPALGWESSGLFKPKTIPMESCTENENDLKTQLELTQSSLNKCYQDLKSKNDQLNDTQKNLNNCYENLKNRNVQLNNLQTLTDELKTLLKEKETKLCELREVENDYKNKLERANHDLESVKKELTKAEEIFKTCNNSQLKYEEENNLLQDEMKKLKLQLRKTEQNLKDSEKKSEDYSDELKQLKLDYQGARNRWTVKNSIISFLKDKYCNLTKDDDNEYNEASMFNVEHNPENYEDSILLKLQKDFALLKTFNDQVERLKKEALLINVLPENFAHAVLDLKKTEHLYVSYLINIAKAASLPIDNNFVDEIKKRLEADVENFNYVNFATCFPTLTPDELEETVRKLPDILDELETTVKEYNQAINREDSEWLNNFIKWIKSVLKKLETTAKKYIAKLDCKNPEWVNHVALWIVSERKTFENCQSFLNDFMLLTPDITMKSKYEWKELFTERYKKLLECANSLIEPEESIDKLPSIMKEIKTLIPKCTNKTNWLYVYIKKLADEKKCMNMEVEETPCSSDERTSDKYLQLKTQCLKLATYFGITLQDDTFYQDVMKSEVIRVNLDSKNLEYLKAYFNVNCPDIFTIVESIENVFTSYNPQGNTQTECENPHKIKEYMNTFANHVNFHYTNSEDVAYKNLLHFLNLEQTTPKHLFMDIFKNRIEHEWTEHYNRWLTELNLRKETTKDEFLNHLIALCKTQKNEKSKRSASTVSSDTFEKSCEKKMKLAENWSYIEIGNLVYALYKELFVLKWNYLKNDLPTKEDILNKCNAKLRILEKLSSKKYQTFRENELLKMYTQYVKIDLAFHSGKTNYFTDISSSISELLKECMDETHRYIESLNSNIQNTTM